MRVRITNNSLNSYGTRILTSGMNIEQYSRNPVLLYMHRRGNVIGLVKDLKIEDNEVTGEIVFDEATELSRQCSKQFKFGSLRMVSVGIDIIEMSEDRQYLVPGQTRPTITKSKLFEVSLVDVGANDDAIVLFRDGKQIAFGKDGENILPLLNTNKKKEKQMEQKKLALTLGLPETADEAAIIAAIDKLKSASAELAKVTKEKEALCEATIATVVDCAITEKRITADNKKRFVELGKMIGLDKLREIFSAMAPHNKLAELVGHHGGVPTGQYKKLSDVPEAERLAMRDDNPEMYKMLYRAEYGCECELL